MSFLSILKRCYVVKQEVVEYKQKMAAGGLRGRNQYDVCGQLQTDFYDLNVEIH